MKHESKHPEQNRLLTHTAIYLLARGFPGLLAFLAIPLFTRLLTPADYGRYALILAGVNLVNTFVFQGIRLSVVRYLPGAGQYSSELKSTLVSAVLISLGVLLSALLLVAALSHFVRSWTPVLLCIWTLLAITALYEICCEYARATIRPWRYMGLQAVRAGALLGLGGLLVVLGFRWWGPLTGLALGMAIATLYSYFTDWRDVGLRINRAVLVKLCRYGLPLSMTVALTALISTSDRFLIAALLGPAPAGVYSVAADLASQTVTVLMISVYLAVFPLAVRAWEEKGEASAVAQMQYNGAILVALGLPCVVGIAILTPGIANVLLGHTFAGSAAVIPIIAVATFVAGMKSCHFDAAMQFTHHTMDQVYIVLVAAVLNIGICLVAIRMAGINGAAFASAVVYLVAVVLTIVWGRRYVALSIAAGPALKAALATAFMAMVLLPFRSYTSPLALFSQIAVGATVYGVALVMCNFLDLRAALLHKLKLAASVPLTNALGLRGVRSAPERAEDASAYD